MNPFDTNNFLASLSNATYTLPVLGELQVGSWLAAFIVFIVLTLAFWVIRNVVIKHLHKLSSKTGTDIDDVVIAAVQGIRVWVYTIASLFFALQMVSVPNWFDKTITAVFLFAVVWQLIEIALKFVSYFSSRFLERDNDGDGEVDPGSATASHMVDLAARIILWVLGILFILSNLGIEVTSLLAGLGIGGLAVALALQGILSDLFASFSIYLDRPFRIGDFVVVGNDSGTIQKIGVKSTRIKTLQGEELVISNMELTSARVNNYKKMQERRIVTKIGVLYETPLGKLKQIETEVIEIFNNLEGGRLDRVHFTTFGDFSLTFEIVYYIESPDHNDYLNVQQIFNFSLMERFQKLGIEFAYPTQTILTKSIT
ncbi:MAG: mechanosensitive ion channel family protein [Candidatus Nomurabacteria bacterium]|nr:mechanosensitive ion channel family protein [Candidatus Nomurabacteria bacterium]USN87413.1 MAG: mechanosensitive ion channel family protein [Candidatus Nomurabacteria bacterium]